MKTLVTGATGLLGSNVVRILRDRGIEVRILARPNADTVSLEGIQVERYTGDITDPEAVIWASRGCDAIVHAAANTSQWPTGYQHYHDINVKGTENVVRAARISKVQKMIHVGTVNSFGHGTREHPGTELSEFSLFRFNSGYVISKFVAQQYVLQEVEKHGLPIVIVNPSFMIGPYDSKPSTGKMILPCLKNRIWAYPAGGRNYIDVRDAAKAICNALDLGIPGECYILANENLTFKEFYRKVNQAAGRKQLLVGIGTPFIRLAGTCGSLVSRLGGKRVALNNVNAQLMTQSPVENALADAIDWYRSHGMISFSQPQQTVPEHIKTGNIPTVGYSFLPRPTP
jgi:dihydroflavonol-4-reductase